LQLIIISQRDQATNSINLTFATSTADVTRRSLSGDRPVPSAAPATSRRHGPKSEWSSMFLEGKHATPLTTMFRDLNIEFAVLDHRWLLATTMFDNL